MGRKILMLHGFSQNANIFSKRTGAIRKGCGKDIEFVFVDAPMVLRPADYTSKFLEGPDVTEIHESETDPELLPRGWWRVNAERTRSVGLLESVVLLRDVLKGAKFDGVFGFSQGAAMAALLAALLEKPHLCPEFLIDNEPPHPPLKFCIAISGFVAADPLSALIFNEGYSTPTLHVLGRTDIIVTEERSIALINVSLTKRVERHNGGHFVPSRADWRELLCGYIRDPPGHIPSPSLT